MDHNIQASLSSENEEELRNALKRCRPDVVEAAIDYQKTGNTENVPMIVLGIIERFLEPESRPKLRLENAENMRLIEDLGIDSLVMIEVVMTIEETLKISIANEDLQELSTLKSVNTYIDKMVNNITNTAVPA